MHSSWVYRSISSGIDKFKSSVDGCCPMEYESRQRRVIRQGRNPVMSRLFEFGPFGKMYVGWHFAPDNKRPFILDQDERGEWCLM